MSRLPKDHEELLQLVKKQVAEAKGKFSMPNQTRVMEALNHLVKANWVNSTEGLTLEADRAGKARQAISRIEQRSLPDPQTKIHRPTKRVVWRPKFYYAQDHEDYSHSWKTWQDFEGSKHQNAELAPLCEMLALYSIALPRIKEYPIFSSFQGYIEDPLKFIEDMKEFNSLTSIQLDQAAKALGISLDSGIETGTQLLIRGLALDGQEPKHSLHNIIQHGKAQMSTANDRPTTARERAKSRITDGAATGGVGALNRAAIEEVLASGGEHVPEIMKTEGAKLLLEGMLPLAAMFATELPMVQGRVNKKALEQINSFAEKALESASHTGTREGGLALYNALRPLLTAYLKGAVGLETLNALTGEEAEVEEDDLMTPLRTPELELAGSGRERGL